MRVLLSAMLWSLAFASGLLAESPVPEKRMTLIRDVDLPGGDIQSIFDTTLEACQTACLADADCVAFTFNTRSNACFPKSSIGVRSEYRGAFSGLVLSTPDAVLQASNARRSDIPFISDRDIAAARRVALTLTNSHVPGDWTVEGLLQSAREAEDDGNIVAAYRFTGAATVLSDAADHWTDYARLALAIQTDKSSERRIYQRRALSASINAYLRAPSPAMQSNALLVLAQALETQNRGRQMIPALRLANALSPRIDTEEVLDAAIAKYGFRITDHTIDNDAARPRICAQFSEDLVKAGVEYGPFVQVPSADLIVEADQRQLCIEGVSHGARYRVTFREGLPARSGEVLAKSVTLHLYVRDRAPGVRFPSRAYILPASGDVAVPVETVNATELDLVLRQISDRNVLRTLQDNTFGRPLSPWQEEAFGNDLSTEVWRGTGTVEGELNADTITRLPLGDIVGGLTPGVYMLRASVPNSDPYDTPAATQWFLVSDIGLATLSGTDGLHVFVRALSTADAKDAVEVSLISRANAVLGTTMTDALGYVRFDPGLALGVGGAAPAMIVARTDTDMAFLSLTDPEFDLADRGVEGREPAGAIDVFLTTERGAYRAGEVINATVLARDKITQAISGLPLTAIFRRPDGVEFQRHVSAEDVAGGHVFAFRTPGTAPRGAWRLDIHADVEAPPLASSTVLVEDFLPERIDFDLAGPTGLVQLSDRPQIDIEARYLFGAPAGDLPVEGSLLLRATRELEAFSGYRFGRYDETPRSELWFFPSETRTDAGGKASVAVELPQIKGAFRPFEALVTARVSEGSGRPVERTTVIPVASLAPVIGIKPLFEGTLPEDSDASFHVVALDNAQNSTALDVKWSVNQVRTRYQWYSYDGRWAWEPVTTRTKVADGTVTLGADPISITAPVTWGRYEIKVERVGGPYIAASQDFYAGWYGSADATSTPDVLDVSLDAEKYRPGETATLRLVPRHPGKALITVVSNRLIDMKAVDVAAGETLVELPVTDAWGAGAYVTATLIRPMDVEQGRNPARSIGLRYAPVDPGQKALRVAFETPDAVDPRGPLPVALRVDGVTPGEQAYVTIAAVDVGILNLTGFAAPDVTGHYFGQRKLGIGMRDVYGRLIDGLTGALGDVRSGGDAGALAGFEAPPPTEELVAFFSGPLLVGADGYARTSFDLPSFNGTVKLMAVAWSATSVGDAEADVLVRDPVVVTASLPRFLAPGDRSRLLLELVHASGPTGQMQLSVRPDGLRLNRAVPGLVTLEENARIVLSLPITADMPGLHKVEVALTTPDGRVLTKDLTVPVQVNDPIIARTSRFRLAAGDTFTFSQDVFADLRPGTGSATLAAGPIARLDAPGLLEALDRYPYGCTEQVTSRALPLLYFDEMAAALNLGAREALTDRIDASVSRVLANQSSNGSFGLWRAASGDFWLDAYVTDFLSRARQQGYDVPDVAFRLALDNLRNRVNYAPDFDRGGEALAYGLYVLAREGAAAIGDLRYYADVKAEAFSTPLAAAQLGAALAAYGDPTRADRMFRIATRRMSLDQETAEKWVWRSDYGTHLRDRAAVLTLAIEAGSAVIDQDALLDSIAPLDGAHRRSTQEQVWSLLAAHAILGGGNTGDLTLDGARVTGPLVQFIEDHSETASRAIRNIGDGPTKLTLNTFGVPEVPVPAGGNGYAIERRYFTMDGAPIDIDSVAQGTRLVTVLTVTPFEEVAARLMVDDPLPAGFEIDNPNLLRGGDIRALDWLDLYASPENVEFRQERFLAAVDWRSDEPFRLAYIVRAGSPGAYHHPAASVEDMYRPDARAQSDAGRVIITE